MRYFISWMDWMDKVPVPATFMEYRRHYYLISRSFSLVRVVGFSTLAQWLYRGGPEVEELLSPSAHS